MELRPWLLSWIFFPGALFAYVEAGPKVPAPATADYQKIVSDLNRTTFAVVTYYDGNTSIVTDAKWIERFKKLLAATEGKPDSYCLCINYPEITLLNKDQELTTLEVAHGKKLRFGGANYSGDFVIDENIAKAIVMLALSEKVNSMPRPKKNPKKPGSPPRLELIP